MSHVTEAGFLLLASPNKNIFSLNTLSQQCTGGKLWVKKPNYIRSENFNTYTAAQIHLKQGSVKHLHEDCIQLKHARAGEKRVCVAIPNSFFQDLIRDFAKDVTSSSVLCLRIAFTDIPILVDCNRNKNIYYKRWHEDNLTNKHI